MHCIYIRTRPVYIETLDCGSSGVSLVGIVENAFEAVCVTKGFLDAGRDNILDSRTLEKVASVLFLLALLTTKTKGSAMAKIAFVFGCSSLFICDVLGHYICETVEKTFTKRSKREGGIIIYFLYKLFL